MTIKGRSLPAPEQCVHTRTHVVSGNRYLHTSEETEGFLCAHMCMYTYMYIYFASASRYIHLAEPNAYSPILWLQGKMAPPKRSAVSDVVTREVTINLHKRCHSTYVDAF